MLTNVTAADVLYPRICRLHRSRRETLKNNLELRPADK
jgi:hypothetical protein